jgi:dihydromethanopterin reductase (acceptor)
MKRIAWAITGAGHLLRQCADFLLTYENLDLFLSRAAEEVIRMYRLKSIIEGRRVIYDRAASAPVVGQLARGTYGVLIIAPATSNSVAKFVYGISDSLVSNMFAQAGKSQVPIIVLPTDLAPEMDTEIPSGKIIKVYPRPVDLENTEKLRGFPGVTVVTSLEELKKQLGRYAQAEG